MADLLSHRDMYNSGSDKYKLAIVTALQPTVTMNYCMMNTNNITKCRGLGDQVVKVIYL